MATATSSATKTSKASVPAAAVPAAASATVPATTAIPAAPAAIPTATTATIPAAAAPAAPARPVGGTSLCGAAAPNHFWTDPRDNIQRGYVATWKIGCSTFQQHEAKAYCESMGMEPV